MADDLNSGLSEVIDTKQADAACETTQNVTNTETEKNKPTKRAVVVVKQPPESEEEDDDDDEVEGEGDSQNNGPSELPEDLEVRVLINTK